jgi:hypothetical protein
VNSTVQGGGLKFSMVSDADKNTYSGSVVKIQDGPNTNVVLRLNRPGSTANYDIYYPFFTTNSLSTPVFGTQAKAAFLTDPQAAGPPSRMVFACDAVFADNAQRTGQPSDFNPKVLADIENSISAAFNRGIALNDPSTWKEGWFPAGGVFNYWVEFWHESGRAINDEAYAFPYDDKFGKSTNLQQNSLTSIGVGLGSWGQLTRTRVAMAVPNASSLKQNGPISASVSVSSESGTPTGTVAFFINGVFIASPQLDESVAALPNDSKLPPLPDGGNSHTYTLTAVYSGDATFTPSIAFQSLALARS